MIRIAGRQWHGSSASLRDASSVGDDEVRSRSHQERAIPRHECTGTAAPMPTSGTPSRGTSRAQRASTSTIPARYDQRSRARHRRGAKHRRQRAPAARASALFGPGGVAGAQRPKHPPGTAQSGMIMPATLQPRRRAQRDGRGPYTMVESVQLVARHPCGNAWCPVAKRPGGVATGSRTARYF